VQVTVWYACYMYTCTNCKSSWLFTRITTLNCLVSETLAIYKFCRLIFLLFYDFQTTTFRENFLIPTAGDVITRIPFPFTLLLETQTVEESRNIFTFIPSLSKGTKLVSEKMTFENLELWMTSQYQSTVLV